MNGLGFLFCLITAGALVVLPRRWASVPLLLGALYMPMGQEVEMGPLHFTVVRILIAAGMLRVAMKGERLAGGLKRLDSAMILWAITAVGTSAFHKDPAATFVYRLGVTYDCLGTFLLFRIFVRTPADLARVFRATCLLMVPIGVGMMVEKITDRNCFTALLGGAVESEIRNGHVRASGPFVHAILAGTVGAACFPMAVCLWSRERLTALAGLAGSGAVVVASGSSGPIMTLMTILFGIGLWTRRRWLPAVCWLALILIFGLSIMMNDPVYYLLARIDLTGGSTGYHRAALIQATIDHLGEWWLIGTDFTRHWLPTGIPANAVHTDLTNHYVAMGVMGGMPLLLLFIWVLYTAFADVGQALRPSRHVPRAQQFWIWTLGATLFGHATTFFSISYFGQAIAFLYLLLGTIGSLQAMWPASSAMAGARQNLGTTRRLAPVLPVPLN